MQPIKITLASDIKTPKDQAEDKSFHIIDNYYKQDLKPNRMIEGGCSSRKRVKMKPPWLMLAAASFVLARKRNRQPRHPRCLYPRPRQASSNFKPVIYPAAMLTLLLAIVLAIVCDLHKLVSCSRVPTGPGDRGRQVELSLERGASDGEPAAAPATGLTTFEIRHTQASPSETRAHFNLNKMARVVSASSYQTEVYLPCQILNLDEDQTVSWIRKRDSLVLTIDKLRLVDDARFELNQAPDDWSLVLSQPNELDAGLYECQVSSMEPKLSHSVELRMVRAESSISNFSSLYVRPNDLINLTCSIVAPQATSYVYWYKNKEVAHFDNLRLARTDGKPSQVARAGDHPSSSSRSGASRDSGSGKGAGGGNTYGPVKPVRVAPPSQRRVQSRTNNRHQAEEEEAADEDLTDRAKEEEEVQWSRSSSTLIIREAQLNDTANYTCLPANAKPSQIRVIVIENGLGSQPEKRSLQADGSSVLIISPYSTWLKVRNLLFDRPETLWNLADCGYLNQGCNKDQNIAAKVMSSYAKSFIARLGDVLGDGNAINWTLSILVAIYIIA